MLRLQQDFGGQPRGAMLSLAVAGNEHSRAFLPVEPTEAQVIATDQRGRPALLLRRVGRGSLILGTCPVEHMAALTPRVNPDGTLTLFGALATILGRPARPASMFISENAPSLLAARP